jgi:ABC-2 type transport system permease protein
MMKSLLIAWKDFKVRMCDRRGFMMMILMPLVLTAILGSALSGVMGNESLPTTVLAYYQADEDAAAVMLKRDVLAGSNFKDVIQIKEVSSKEEAARLVKTGKADVGLIIPPGWSANLKGGGKGTIAAHRSL